MMHEVFYIRNKISLQDRLAEHKYAIRAGNVNYPMALGDLFLGPLQF